MSGLRRWLELSEVATSASRTPLHRRALSFPGAPENLSATSSQAHGTPILSDIPNATLSSIGPKSDVRRFPPVCVTVL
jgi:hypothetical protein